MEFNPALAVPGRRHLYYFARRLGHGRRHERPTPQHLSVLHRLQTPHRDITPPNVYIGNRNTLLLGDYGITKAALLKKGVRADALLIRISARPQENDVKIPAVNQLTSKGRLREIIKDAIRIKAHRYKTAMEMAEALRGVGR